MKLTKEEIGEVADFLSKLDEYEPLVDQVVPAAQKAVGLILRFGPVLTQLADPVAMAFCRIKRKQIAYYEAEGFSREDAIFLVQDEWYAVQRNLRNRKKD